MSATGRATTRFKEMWKRYGAVAIGTYLSTYAVVLGSFYASIEYGLIDRNPPKPNLSDSDDDFNLVKTTNRVVAFAEKLGVAEFFDLQRVDSKTGSFLLAWIATKFTEPLRLAFTVAVTPRIARILGRK